LSQYFQVDFFPSNQLSIHVRSSSKFYSLTFGLGKSEFTYLTISRNKTLTEDSVYGIHYAYHKTPLGAKLFLLHHYLEGRKYVLELGIIV